MYIKPHGYTPKQMSYAMYMMNGQAKSRKEAASLSGFAPMVGKNTRDKIEKTKGYKNAMAALSMRSSNLLMAVMFEFEARGLENFNNKELLSTLSLVTSTWNQIDVRRGEAAMKTEQGNPLRAVFTRRIETQKAVIHDAVTTPTTPTIDLDF